MLLMGIIRISMLSVNKNAGHGSNKHYLHGEDLMIFKTYSSETGLNLEKRVGSELQCNSSLHHDQVGKLFLIFFILILK